MVTHQRATEYHCLSPTLSVLHQDAGNLTRGFKIKEREVDPSPTLGCVSCGPVNSNVTYIVQGLHR